MPSFVSSGEVRASPQATFAYIVDLANWSSFTGHGPLPGIAEASLPDGGAVGPGARIRVRNTDGSVHHEVVQRFEPGRLYAVRMELVPPASYLMARIDEVVELSPTPTGTRVVRTFTTVPRSFLTWPFVWLMTHLLLKPAVAKHDRAAAVALGA